MSTCAASFSTLKDREFTIFKCTEAMFSSDAPKRCSLLFVKLRPQTPPIDKREIGDAVIPGERRIHTSPSAPPTK